MSKTKLEQAVDDIENKFRKLVAPQLKTINDNAINWVARQICFVQDQETQQLHDHQHALNVIWMKMNNLHIAAKIISGEKGFIRLQQCTEIQSGFTCFPEILSQIAFQNVRLTLRLEDIELFPGTKIYSIDERGMMTLHSQLVDSSD